MSYDFEIHRISGIVGQVIAYQYNTTFGNIYKYIDNVIDNNKDLIYKIWDSNNNYYEIKTRHDLEKFKNEVLDND